MNTVWTLESHEQELAAEVVNSIVEEAFAGSRKAQNYLRKLWDGEKWSSIKEKLEVEGSSWYVWFMDGVNHHICLENDIPWNQ